MTMVNGLAITVSVRFVAFIAANGDFSSLPSSVPKVRIPATPPL